MPGAADSLQKIYTGGAPVFPILLDRLRRAFPRSRPVAVYGSTEAEPISHIGWEEMDEADREIMRGGGGILAGVPVPEIRLRLAADDEIQVAGDHVLRGYWQGVGDEENKIREGDTIWHRTGDAGRLDARGRLWLLGRCSARIGHDLYPFTVECAASSFPWVRRSGCVETRSGRVLAVECRSGARPEPDTLRAAFAWAGIDRVVVVKELPVDRRHNAKINYPALRRLVS